MLFVMHVGIAVTMSARVGLIFVTSLPAYTIGFSCTAPVASATWMVAAVIGLMPTATAALFRRRLPENWPSSPISLFMFSAPQVLCAVGMHAELQVPPDPMRSAQASAMLRLFMNGDTRLVLSAEVTCRPALTAAAALLRALSNLG
jgi:hypothetical protein